MAAETFTQTYTFRDAKGQTATMRFYITSLTSSLANANTAAAALTTAVANLSNAFLQAAHGPSDGGTRPVTYGNAAQFEEVPSKAQMLFASAVGSLHRFMIPAPIAAAFKADLQTVDPANASVIAFVNAVTTAVAAGDAFVSSRDGVQITRYLGGLYRGRKVGRRISTLVRDSTLTDKLPAL